MNLPTEMCALTAPKFTKPENYKFIKQAIPTIFSPTDVLVRVHAFSINPIDVKKANGLFRFFEKLEFPLTIGLDCSGTIVEVGEDVTEFEPGDEVFTAHTKFCTATEYVVVPAKLLARKPTGITHTQAAALPVVAMTSLKALQRAAATIPGGLEGKTVLIPGALSGTGHIALQLAKHVFKAGKVITTASPGKIGRLPELLGAGTVDQVVDYTIHDVLKEVPRGSVDFLFDTMAQSWKLMSLVKPQTGMILSISTIPSGDLMKGEIPEIPGTMRVLTNSLDAVFQWKARRWGVNYSYFFPDMTNISADLEQIGAWVQDGTVKVVVGKTARMEDEKAVIEGCEQIMSGHGGIGKFVIEVV